MVEKEEELYKRTKKRERIKKRLSTRSIFVLPFFSLPTQFECLEKPKMLGIMFLQQVKGKAQLQCK